MAVMGFSSVALAGAPDPSSSMQQPSYSRAKPSPVHLPFANTKNALALVVIDDSAGMCGYLAPGSNFKRALSVIQSRLEMSQDYSGARLYYLGDNEGRDAIPQLDKLANGALNDRSCPLRRGTSPISNFFSKGAEADVTLMLTDLIFDEGRQAGLAASRTAFLDAAVRWQSAGAHNVGFGIIALRSKFDGVYFAGNGQASTARLSTERRPFFLLWRAKDTEAAQTFMNGLFKSLQEKMVAPAGATDLSRSFIFLPEAGLSESFSLLRRPRTLSDHLVQGGPAGQRPIITYEYADPKMIPKDPSAKRPSRCFAWERGGLSFLESCGAGMEGVGDQNFSSLAAMSVTAVHVWIEIDHSPGLARTVTRLSRPGDGLQVSIQRVCSPSEKVVPPKVCADLGRHYPSPRDLFDGTPRTFAVVSLRVGAPLVLNAGMPEQRSQWKESFTANATPDQSVLKDESAIWSAQREPCAVVAESASECKSAAESTVGFESLVTSLAGRIDSIGKTVERMTSESREFDVVVRKVRAGGSSAKKP